MATRKHKNEEENSAGRRDDNLRLLCLAGFYSNSTLVESLPNLPKKILLLIALIRDPLFNLFPLRRDPLIHGRYHAHLRREDCVRFSSFK